MAFFQAMVIKSNRLLIKMVEQNLADKCRKDVEEYCGVNQNSPMIPFRVYYPINTQNNNPPSYNRNRESTGFLKMILIGGVIAASVLIAYAMKQNESPKAHNTNKPKIVYEQKSPSKPMITERNAASQNISEDSVKRKYTEPAETYYRSAKRWIKDGRYYYADKKINSALHYDPHNVKYNALKARIAVEAKVKDLCDHPELKYKLRQAKADIGDKLREVFGR